MEKRNTMLLTVIAVATLLVAVVGATFAYFSLSVQGNATTTANVTAGSVGTVELDQGVSTLALSVTGQEMAPGQTDVYYYAVEGPGSPQTTGGIWVKNEDGGNTQVPTSADLTIATATREGGSQDDTYTCEYTVKVEKLGTSDMVPQAGDLKLTITGPALKEGETAEVASSETTVDTDFVNYSTAYTYTGKFVIEGSEEGTYTPQNIKASLYLVNKKQGVEDAGKQDYLAGKKLDVKITVSSKGACTITSAGE